MTIACSVCHTTQGWRVDRAPPGFDHATVGRALAGAHATVACSGCHRDLVFAHIGASCVDCHADVHHGNLGTDCSRCHTEDRWDVSRSAIEQHAATAFPLTGAHAAVDCDACHRSAHEGDYAGAPLRCEGCHLASYRATSNPAHAGAGFGTNCDECHVAAAPTWTAAGFQHPAFFPLIGGHARARCGDCHASGYRGTPVDCDACHERDFVAATNPNHVTAGFPRDCRQCHGYDSWSGASFDHARTGFPLQGVHATISCQSCHASGYTGTPSACYACHQADYAGATNPDHQALGFSHDCATCHGFASWSGATFDHDPLFPIYSGAHLDRWTSCADCHRDPSSYRAFECIFCHTHERTVTDGHHQAVAGYVYQSAACYNCHPTGRRGG